MAICEDFHGSTDEFCGEKWRALYQPPNKEIDAQLYVQNVMSSLAIAEFQTVDIGINVLVSREFLKSVENNGICPCPACQVDAPQLLSFTICRAVDTCTGRTTINNGKCLFLNS